MRKVAIEILMMIVVREESEKNRRVWVFEEKTVSELMLQYSVFHFNHAGFLPWYHMKRRNRNLQKNEKITIKDERNNDR